MFHRIQILAAAVRRRPVRSLALTGGVVALLWLGAGVAQADVVAYYYSGPVYAGETITSAYDNTCADPYWIYYNEFDKGSSDYGRVFFIDSGGTWKDEVSGDGDIWTSVSSYTWQKKAAIRNPSNVGYTGSAWLIHTNPSQCV